MQMIQALQPMMIMMIIMIVMMMICMVRKSRAGSGWSHIFSRSDSVLSTRTPSEGLRSGSWSHCSNNF